MVAAYDQENEKTTYNHVVIGSRGSILCFWHDFTGNYPPAYWHIAGDGLLGASIQV